MGAAVRSWLLNPLQDWMGSRCLASHRRDSGGQPCPGAPGPWDPSLMGQPSLAACLCPASPLQSVHIWPAETETEKEEDKETKGACPALCRRLVLGLRFPGSAQGSGACWPPWACSGLLKGLLHFPGRAGFECPKNFPKNLSSSSSPEPPWGPREAHAEAAHLATSSAAPPPLGLQRALSWWHRALSVLQAAPDKSGQIDRLLQ